jgi:hypothetical protein
MQLDSSGWMLVLVVAATWKPSVGVDAEIRQWMLARGWVVNRTEYGPRSRVYAWRCERPDSNDCPTLRISREVLETYPGWALIVHLDQLRVAAVIRAQPQARLVVTQQGDSVVFKEVSSKGRRRAT